MKQLQLNLAGFVLKRTKILFTAVLVLGASHTAANAATSTWTDSNLNDTWSDGNDWSPTGIPAASNIALFDGQGDTGTITVGTESIGTVQFGQTGELVPTAIAYTLGNSGDALRFDNPSTSSSSPDVIVSYQGAGNTATQKVNANLVLNSGDTATSGVKYYSINNASAGNLILNGSITDGDTAGEAAEFDFNETGATGSNTTVNGNITINYQSIVNVNVGDSVTFGGAISIGRPSTTYLNLGSTSTTTSGNVILTGSGTESSLLRLAGYGTSGAFVFDSSTGITFTQGFNVYLEKEHSSESAPNIEFESGNNLLLNTESVAIDAGTAATGSYYLQVDSGATVGIAQIKDTAGTGSFTQTTYLDGAGNGVVTGGYLTGGSGETAALVKDGAGTWALGGTSTASGVTQTSNYTGGTTVEEGTLLVTNTAGSGTGTGAVLVSGASSSDTNAKPILGGTGTISGAVTLASGGTIAPGGTVTGGTATTPAVTVTSPFGNIGTLTLATNITATTGSTFAFDINSGGPFASGLGSSDLLTVIGTATLGSATLSLNDIGSGTLTAGDYFDILNYTTLSGTFDVNGATLNGGNDVTVGGNIYSINYDYVNGSQNEVVLDYLGAAPEPSIWALVLLSIPLLIWQRRRTASKM
jgi:autotransporter-associated beta strand protein